MQNGADNLLYYGIKRTKEISGYLKFSDNAYSFVLQPKADGKMFIASEKAIIVIHLIFPQMRMKAV